MHNFTHTFILFFFFLSYFQNTPVGTPIFIVNATDPDQGAGGSVLYSFQPPSNFFAIDSGRGIVSVIRELDYEVTQAYQLQVNATVSLLLPSVGEEVFLGGTAMRKELLLAYFIALLWLLLGHIQHFVLGEVLYQCGVFQITAGGAQLHLSSSISRMSGARA